MTIAGRPLPYVVARLDYTPPSNDETGRIFVELKANSKGDLATLQVRISAGEITGKTVAEIFAAKGLFRETPAEEGRQTDPERGARNTQRLLALTSLRADSA